MKRILQLAIIIPLLIACTEEDTEIDSSVITNFDWYLAEKNLPFAFDLNRDGTPSVNMIDELPCLSESTLEFVDVRGEEFVYSTGVFLILSMNGEMERWECGPPFDEDGNPNSAGSRGTYAMIDENTIECSFEENPLFPAKVVRYSYSNGQLIRNARIEAQVDYDEDKGEYITREVNVEFVFSKAE